MTARIDATGNKYWLRCETAAKSTLRIASGASTGFNLPQAATEDSRIVVGAQDEGNDIPSAASGSLFERVHAQMENFARSLEEENEERQTAETLTDTEQRLQMMQQLSTQNQEDNGKIGDVDDSFERGEDSNPDRNSEVSHDIQNSGHVESTEIGEKEDKDTNSGDQANGGSSDQTTEKGDNDTDHEGGEETEHGNE
jgi:hypothetical protein